MTQAEKARIIIDNQKQDTFQFVSVWLRFWRSFINPCVFKLARNMNFHLKFL